MHSQTILFNHHKASTGTTKKDDKGVNTPHRRSGEAGKEAVKHKEDHVREPDPSVKKEKNVPEPLPQKKQQ